MDADTMRCRIQDEARKLAAEWGIKSGRRPIGSCDTQWMIGYDAACKQLIAAADKIKDD